MAQIRGPYSNLRKQGVFLGARSEFEIRALPPCPEEELARRTEAPLGEEAGGAL